MFRYILLALLVCVVSVPAQAVHSFSSPAPTPRYSFAGARHSSGGVHRVAKPAAPARRGRPTTVPSFGITKHK